MRIEIEDYYGNTLMTFEVKDEIDIKDISNLEECGIADVEEYKEIGSILRIQSNNKKIKEVLE